MPAHGTPNRLLLPIDIIQATLPIYKKSARNMGSNKEDHSAEVVNCLSSVDIRGQKIQSILRMNIWWARYKDKQVKENFILQEGRCVENVQ